MLNKFLKKWMKEVAHLSSMAFFLSPFTLYVLLLLSIRGILYSTFRPFKNFSKLSAVKRFWIASEGSRALGANSWSTCKRGFSTGNPLWATVETKDKIIMQKLTFHTKLIKKRNLFWQSKLLTINVNIWSVSHYEGLEEPKPKFHSWTQTLWIFLGAKEWSPNLNKTTKQEEKKTIKVRAHEPQRFYTVMSALTSELMQNAI